MLNAVPELLGITTLQLLYACAVVFLAAVVRGYTGFGFSALCVASLSLVFPPVQVVPVILLMEVIASLAMLREVWRHIDWRLVRHLCIGAFAGAPVGIYMLLHFSENAVRVFISLCVLLAAVAMLGGFQLQAKRGMPATVAVGVLSGLVNGVGAVGGLPVVVFMLAAGTSAAMIRASIVVFFLINDTYASTINVFTGVLTFQTLLWVAVLFVPLTVGVLIGSRQFSARSPASFRRMALWLLVLLSIAGLVRTVAG